MVKRPKGESPRRRTRIRAAVRHTILCGPERLEDRQMLALWSGDIPNNTVWHKSEVQEITGNVRIPAGATLTIEAGTVVKFDAGRDFSIQVDGRMLAQGTVAERIYFTSMNDDTVGGDSNLDGSATTPAPFQWESINFTNSNPAQASVLDHVEVRYGGENVVAEVIVNGGALTLSNSVVASCATAGIRIQAANPTLTNVTFKNNPVAATMDLSSNPTISGVTMVGNVLNALRIDGGTLPANNAWDDPDIVYAPFGNITVPAGRTLTIAPGQTIKFRELGDLTIHVSGTLLAQGTVQNPIVFTSLRDDSAGGDTNGNGTGSFPAAFDWEALTFDAGSSGSVLDHVAVRYGGENVPGAVLINGGQLSLTNSTILASATAGIRIQNANPTISGVFFKDNAFAATMDLGSNPAINNVSMLDNGVNGLRVDGGTLTANLTWDNPGITYLVQNEVTVPAAKSLTIAPGQIIKFRERTGIGIVVNGTLSAVGTASTPIVFTSSADDSVGGDTYNDGNQPPSVGHWRGLRLESTSRDNLLSHVDVRYAGESGDGAVVSAGAPLTLTDSSITASSSAGVRVQDAVDTVSNLSLENNIGPAIGVNLSGDVLTSDVSAAGNGINAVVVDGGTLSASRSLVGTGLPYQLGGNLTVSGGVTFTVGQGAIFQALEPFSVAGPGTVANAGLIRKSIGSTSTFASALVNTGTIKVENSVLNLAGGLTNNGNGAITGSVGPTIAIGGNFVGTTQNLAAFTPLETILMNGAGTPAAPQLVEALSADKGAIGTGFEHNFGLYSLAVGGSTYVKLVDNADNVAGSGAEAIYAANVVVPFGTTLDLNNFHLYARATQINGTVKNGSITIIPDGGPLARDAVTPGRISITGEIDDWTIFGRAGDTLTINLSTRDGGFAPPLSPQLVFGQVSLVGPNGQVVPSANNDATASADVLLNAVTLPADGTYHIKVQAAPGHPASTGNYVLAAWKATVNTAPLELGKTITGRIDSSFSSDRWTFSIAADQVVHFSLINAESSGIQFDLSGPNGFSANGLSNTSGDLALHTAGTYAISVHSTQQQTGAYAFRLNQTAVAQLNLGTPLTVNIAGSGQSQLFQLNVPQAQQLVISLTDANAADRNEVYVSQGSPPTRSDYQYKFETPASANQRVSVPSASAGTWYVLVFNENAPQAGSFTLRATGGTTFLQSATPSRGSTSSDTVVTLTGLGFNSTTTVQMVSGANIIPATSVRLDLPTQITATFAANSVPAGDYTVQINNQPNTTPIPFTLVSGGQSKFVVSVDAPKGLGYHNISTFYLNYGNQGDAAVPAPLLTFTPTQTHTVNGAEVTEHNAFLTLDRSRIISGFSTSGLPDGFSHTIELLGSGNTPGVLQPGESMRVPIYWAGWQQPWDLSYPQFHFEIQAADINDPTPVDWDHLKANIPSSFDPAARDAIWENVKTQMGNTLGGYVAALDKTAAYLGQFGERVNDVNQLFEFQIDIANGLSLSPQLLALTDAASPAPGIPLNFSRGFSAQLDRRNQLGLLGRGWAWLEGWDDTLTVDSDGSAVIRSSDGKQAVFSPRPGGGYYIPPPGDSSKLLGSSGNPWTLQETDGTVTAYRADGHVDYVRDPSANQVSTTYTNGLLTKLTHSSGQTMKFAYNTAGRVTSVTDNEGRVTQFGYDASNEHLIAVTDSDGLVTTYTYDISGNLLTQNALLSVANLDGTHLFYSYDTHGRLSELHADGNSEQMTFTYGPLGQVSQTDALGGTTTVLFDNHGQVAQVEDPLHRRMFHIFDANGVLIATVDAAGQRSTYGYDEAGNLASITDPLGHTVRYEHKGLRGTISKITDAKGNPIRYIHGYNGRLLNTIYADGLVESNAYDPVGNLIRSTDRKGQTTNYTHDSAGRILTQTFADNSSVTYAYDTHGNMTLAVDSANGTVTLVYDAHDLLTQIDYPGGKFLKYAYDAAGRRMQMADQTGFKVNYAYDSAGRLAGLTDGSNLPIVSYTYDNAGQIKRKDNGNSTYTTYQYDLLGQVQSVVNFAPDNSVSSRSDYDYDALGRATSMSTLDGQWSYGYDPTGQLTHAVFVSSNLGTVANQDLQYTYDAAGNRMSTIINGVTTGYNSNNLNQYTSIGTASLQYDRNGNLIERKDGGATTTYTYDMRDRLIAVSAPGDNWSYQYDALSHLASETHNGQTIQNLVDDIGLGDVVAQFDGAGALISHFAYGDGLVSRVDAGGAKAYYQFDANGNAVGLTGAAGVMLNHYRYLPFGSLLTSNETIVNPFKFDGQEGVRVTGPGLHFMRNRFYDAASGHFTQPDPIGASGGLNLYRYAENNPISFSDPSGLAPAWYGSPEWLEVLAEVRRLAPYVPAPIRQKFVQAFLQNPTRNAGYKLILQFNKIAQPGFYYHGAYGRVRAFFSKGVGPRVSVPVASTGGKLARLGGGALALIETLLYGAAAGTGLKIGERWEWKRKFEDDFYAYLHKHRPGLGAFLEGTEDFFVINLFSSDPNDKIGPSGAGLGNFIAGDAALPYRIDFENDPKATAPAQVVIVSDILGPSFDLDTFELTGIKFGDVVLTPPPGSQYFATTVQMTQDDKTFDVNVEAGLRTSTREVFAIFESIDPETQLPPEVIYGFLPPEPAHVSDPVAEAATPGRGRGQGQITYSIKPKAGLPSGTPIRNIATIIFDSNPSIATDQVNPHDASAGSDPAKQTLVTIDAGAPTSSVKPLTPKENTSFTVKWTGLDDAGGSGIGTFDVFVSDNNGPYTVWQKTTAATAAMFINAIPLHTYRYYVVATDNVGHVEAVPATFDVQTVISDLPWQNAENRLHVDFDESITASDVITVINYINAKGSGLLPATRPAGAGFVDVTGDKNIAPDDVLTIINYINAHPDREGESPDAIAVPLALTIDGVPVSPNPHPLPADLLALLALDVAILPKRRRT